MGGHPAMFAGEVLNHRQKMALSGTICTADEFRVGMSILGDLAKKFVLRGEPFRVTDVDVSNPLRDRRATHQAADQRPCEWRFRRRQTVRRERRGHNASWLPIETNSMRPT